MLVKETEEVMGSSGVKAKTQKGQTDKMSEMTVEEHKMSYETAYM